MRWASSPSERPRWGWPQQPQVPPPLRGEAEERPQPTPAPSAPAASQSAQARSRESRASLRRSSSSYTPLPPRLEAERALDPAAAEPLRAARRFFVVLRGLRGAHAAPPSDPARASSTATLPSATALRRSDASRASLASRRAARSASFSPCMRSAAARISARACAVSVAAASAACLARPASSTRPWCSCGQNPRGSGRGREGNREIQTYTSRERGQGGSASRAGRAGAGRLSKRHGSLPRNPARCDPAAPTACPVGSGGDGHACARAVPGAPLGLTVRSCDVSRSWMRTDCSSACICPSCFRWSASSARRQPSPSSRTRDSSASSCETRGRRRIAGAHTVAGQRLPSRARVERRGRAPPRRLTSRIRSCAA